MNGHWFQFDPGHALAGGVGGILRYLLNPRRPVLEAVFSGALGVGLAIYFTPIVAPFADLYFDKWLGDGRLDDAQVAAAVGCLIGMAAPNIIERAIEFIQTAKGPLP